MKTVPSVLCAAGIVAVSAFAQQPAAPTPQTPATPAAPATPALPPVAKVEAKDVTADEAEKLIKENPGMIILDVRTPEEFEDGHIKGAVNANVMDAGFEGQVAALDPSKPVLIHCQAGGRSTQALEDLAGKLKAPKVYHMVSGFKGWKNANKPIEGKPLPGAGRPGAENKPAPAAPK